MSNLNSLRRAEIMTDLTLTIAGEISLPVHTLVLVAASSYFERLLMGSFQPVGETLEIRGVSAQILQMYVNLIYGEEIIIPDWKTCFDLYDYLNYTSVNWNKESAVCMQYVPSAEYLEYIGRIDRVYDGEIPKEVIRHTAQFIDPTVDLSGLTLSFLDSLRDPNEKTPS